MILLFNDYYIIASAAIDYFVVGIPEGKVPAFEVRGTTAVY